MPNTSRLSKPTGPLPTAVVGRLKNSAASRKSFRTAKQAAGLASVVAYALLPLVIALASMALLHDWGTSPSSTVAAPIGSANTSDSSHFVPAAISAAGTTRARAGSGESERSGNSGAERTGETAATPLSNPLGSR
jgi:hypothetical protein